MNPPLLLTPGEPAGIGPEIACRVVAGMNDPAERPVLVADPGLVADTLQRLGLDLAVDAVESLDHRRARSGALACLAVSLARPTRPGRLDPANAEYVLACLRRAADECITGCAAGLVTGPVHKGVINDAGIAFSGHTEFLAERAGRERVVMMLAAGDLRVALATTHLPLADVPRAITRHDLGRTLEILDQALREDFGLGRPRIAVLGLNPHAGEGGHLGREEIEVIGPVIAALRERGLDLTDPLPADTAFLPDKLEGFDAVLAMYHDQGLPVLKHAGFSRAVNITLGLGFVRTSVDHGTALDVAGKGVAEITSLQAAIDQARVMTRRRA